MGAKLEEISAVYLRERIRFDDESAIAECRLANGSGSLFVTEKDFSCKVKAEIDELTPQLEYRFYGHWSTYKNKRTGRDEKQFDAKTFVRSQPHGRAGVIAYLCQAGKGNGLGAARAATLWEKFGSDAIRILRETPEVVLAAIPGLTGKQAANASEWLVDEQALEGCNLDLMDLLTGRGFPKDTARKCIKEWGNEAAGLIKRDPYRLMSFRGCGFKRCDALYLHLGLPPTRLRRQALCGWYAIASDTEGHTWYPVATAMLGIRRSIGGTDLRPERAVELATRLGKIAVDRNGALSTLSTDQAGNITAVGGQQWVAEGRKAWCEEQLAELIVNSREEVCQWPDVADIEGISEHQCGELTKSLHGMVGILGGSPGTGKTYTAAKLILKLIQVFGANQIAVGAPTGKAAVRISESMQASGIQIRARTWHSLLGIGKADPSSGNWGFEHGKSNPLSYKVLIGDESSMLDTNLMSSIFRARSVGCHVLLCGDVNQLPPVGHGAPLRDLIAAGLPYGELREIKRNSGGIVEACAAIRDGKPWRAGENLQIFEWGSPELQIKQILQTLSDAKDAGLDRIWDCQAVVAVNEKSDLSRKALNRILQGELNPNPPVSGQPFRLGDKIVNTKNGYFPSIGFDHDDPDTQTNDKNECYCANGEQARVIDVQEKMIIAELSNPKRTVKIPRGKSHDSQDDGDGDNSDKTVTGCSWDLAYAISVHKSQGSEWPWVIVMIDEYPGARMICDRSWIYTAISRAKDRCILIGKKATADRFCRQQKMNQRKTFLRERIHLLSAERILVEL